MKFKFALILTLICITLMRTAAQEDAPEGDVHPLIEMLGFVPLTDTMIYYSDYTAIVTLGGNIAPENYEQFISDDSVQGPWIRRTFRITGGGNPALAYLQVLGEQMPESMGFDFFDVDRHLMFGEPPAQGFIIGGTFDLEAVEAAHVSRDYEVSEFQEIPTLCGPDGCDSGLQVNVADRGTGNYFDPSLGRRPPVLLFSSDYLGSAFDLNVVEAIADAATGNAKSLADETTFGALAQALVDEAIAPGTLLQAIFIPSRLAETYDYSMAESQEQLEELSRIRFTRYSETWREFGDLPPYLIAVLADYQLADYQSEDSPEALQTAVIGLIYGNRESAEIAGAEVANRLALFTLSPDPDAETMLEAIDGVTINEPIIYEIEDRAVVLISVSYPIVDDLNFDSPDRIVGGQVYRAWVNAFIRRSFDPISHIILPDFD